MEALLATLIVALLMVAALAMLAKNWPHSSRLGGYGVPVTAVAGP